MPPPGDVPWLTRPWSSHRPHPFTWLRSWSVARDTARLRYRGQAMARESATARRAALDGDRQVTAMTVPTLAGERLPASRK